MPDVDHTETDSFTFTESGGAASVTPSDQTARDIFRFTERELVLVGSARPALSRPLYGLIELNETTATIVDYQDVLSSAEWRETGVEVDI